MLSRIVALARSLALRLPVPARLRATHGARLAGPQRAGGRPKQARAPPAACAIVANRVIFVSGEPHTPGHPYRVARAQPRPRHRRDGTRRRCRSTTRRGGWTRSPPPPSSSSGGQRGPTRSTGSCTSCATMARRLVFDLDDLVFRPELATVETIDGIRSQNFEAEAVAAHSPTCQHAVAAADACTCTTTRTRRVICAVRQDGVRAAERLRRRCTRAVAPVGAPPARGAGRRAGAHRLCRRIAHPSARFRAGRRRRRARAGANGRTAGWCCSNAGRHRQAARRRRIRRHRRREPTQIEWRPMRAARPTARGDGAVRHQPGPAGVRQSVLRGQERTEISSRRRWSRCRPSPRPPGRCAARSATARPACSRRSPEDWYGALISLVDDAGSAPAHRACGLSRRAVALRPASARAERMLSMLRQMQGGAEGARAFALELAREQAPARGRPPIPRERDVFAVDRLGEADGDGHRAAVQLRRLHRRGAGLGARADARRARSDRGRRRLDRRLAGRRARLGRRNASRFNRILVLRNRANAGLGPYAQCRLRRRRDAVRAAARCRQPAAAGRAARALLAAARGAATRRSPIRPSSTSAAWTT